MQGGRTLMAGGGAFNQGVFLAIEPAYGRESTDV